MRRLPFWAALPLAALGGLLLDLSTPGLAWWPCAFAGVACVLAAVWQQRPSAGALAGFAAGATFWLLHIEWLTLYLGPVPWLGLAGAMIAWYVLFGLAAAWVTRALRRRTVAATGTCSAAALRGRVLAAFGAAGGRSLAWGPRTGAVLQAVAVAGLWVAREQLQSALPYGGFDWGRVAYTQAESPLAQSVSWVGVAALSGAIVCACALVVAGLWPACRRERRTAPHAAAAPAVGGPARRSLRGALLPAVAVALLLLLAVVPTAPALGASTAGADGGSAAAAADGTVRVAAVQGNAQAGIFDDRENGDVFRDHVRETERLLDRLEAAHDSVDVIVWPENSAEFGLPENPTRTMTLQALSRRAAAPIVIGSVLRDEIDGAEQFTNSALVVDPGGVTGERYDKRRPVPFAEYMPNRDFFHALAPDLVDLVQLEYMPGTRPAALPVALADGRTIDAGIAICFDITFEDHARAMQAAGAQVIFAQTNNADFGRTDESAQQLGIARLRAMEFGRTLVNISTVGTSAVVAPDGTELDRLTPYTGDALVADVRLVDGTTPAMAVGPWLAGGWIACAAAGLGAAAVTRARTFLRRRNALYSLGA